jgi:hypothetical protein
MAALRRMTRRLRGALLTTGLAIALAAPAQAARPLDLGFHDGVFSGEERDPWLQRSAGAGADVVRIDIGWRAPNEPVRPAGFDARDPADPAYDFAGADAAIRAAAARGLRVIAGFTGAPRWAEGANRPAAAPPGSWRPDPRALEEYGAAVARRYSGSFPDPLQPGATLPAVAAFQLWNEPNLAKYLSPQWSRGRAAAPAHYRRMLSAFYRGVRSAGTRALVVTAGTAPFGDPHPGGDRIMPVRFVRELLCLRGGTKRLRARKCKAPARFDVLAHHPYSVGSPRRRALNADDVSIPDLGKLARLLRAAERTGGALPRIRHRLWVTEVSYDSRPPDPDGVPEPKHARYLAEALYELWRQGVDTILWFQVRDQRPDPSYAATSQSGVYFADGTPKPARRAFHFPFVARPAGGGKGLVWGRAPVSGRLKIEVRGRSGWRVVHTLRVNARSTFLSHFEQRSSGAVRMRARVGNETSVMTQLLHTRRGG